jgi:hypothetical protein
MQPSISKLTLLSISRQASIFIGILLDTATYKLLKHFNTCRLAVIYTGVPAIMRRNIHAQQKLLPSDTVYEVRRNGDWEYLVDCNPHLQV